MQRTIYHVEVAPRHEVPRGAVNLSSETYSDLRKYIEENF